MQAIQALQDATASTAAPDASIMGYIQQQRKMIEQHSQSVERYEALML